MLDEGIVKTAGRPRFKTLWNEQDEQGKGLAWRAGHFCTDYLLLLAL